MSAPNAEELAKPGRESEQPTPSELVGIAMLLRPDALRAAHGDAREKFLCEAFELWQLGRRVVANEGRSLERVEEDEILAIAAAADAKSEAEAAAKAEPKKVVPFTDAQLRAGLGEGPKHKGETPGQVAERIYHRYRERMISDGRKSEIRPQSHGINLKFALKYLCKPRKRGRKSEGNQGLAEASRKNSESRGKNSLHQKHIPGKEGLRS